MSVLRIGLLATTSQRTSLLITATTTTARRDDVLFCSNNDCYSLPHTRLHPFFFTHHSSSIHSTERNT
jgi:hypothetical protein